MHFQIPNNILLPLLKRLTAVVPAKAMIPAHSSIKVLSREAETVRFYTYSPTIVTEGTLTGIKVAAPFEFGLSENVFSDLMSSIPKDASVSFEVTPTALLVKSRYSEFKVNIFTEDMFLPPRDYSNMPFIKIDMGLFVESLKKVSFCSEARHDRVERTSVCINSDHFVATDGHRMAIYPNKLFKTPHNILISSDAVERIQKVFDKASSDGVFSGSASEIHLGCDGVYASVRLLSGSYPRYKDVIPTGAHTRCLVNRQELISSLERVMVLMSSGTVNNVRFTFKENRIDLFAYDQRHGEGNESLTCECPGLDAPIVLTGSFVTEALKNYSSEKVIMELRAPDLPITLTDGEHLNVIMPIKPTHY